MEEQVYQYFFDIMVANKNRKENMLGVGIGFGSRVARGQDGDGCGKSGGRKKEADSMDGH